MPKFLTLPEIQKIIGSFEPIDDDQAIKLTRDLAAVLTKHAGGELSYVTHHPGDIGAGFLWNGDVPEDGGVFATHDTKVSVKQWFEEWHEGMKDLASYMQEQLG